MTDIELFDPRALILPPSEGLALSPVEQRRLDALDAELKALAIQAWAQPVKREGELSREQLEHMLEQIGVRPVYIRTIAVLRRGVHDEQTGEFLRVDRDILPHWPASEW